MTTNPKTVQIRWGDGYTAVTPTFPQDLLKKLKYWHRSLAWDDEKMQRVSSGEYRELYSINTTIDANQQLCQQLVTMPGFAFRVIEALKKEGYAFEFIDERTPPAPVDLHKACEGLRPYQIECVVTSLRSGGGIVTAPTGWGKTHIMAALVKAHSYEELCARNTPLTVVATPDQDITAKNYRDLVELLPDRQVGLVMAGRKGFSDDVQVITLGSLHHLNMDDIGVLIVDEVHTAASSKRTELLMQARKAVRWGVSATPTGRFDGRDLVTEGLFGPIVYNRTYKQGVEDGALVPIKVIWVKCPIPPMGIDKYLRYKTRAGRYRNGVWKNSLFNKMLADLLTRIPDSRQTLCIMQYLEQMNAISEFCNVAMVHAEKSQDNLTKKSYHDLNPVSQKQRDQVYKDMESGALRKVMSTYVYKQGVNFPQLEIAINPGGGGSDIVAKQIPGRESRKTADKTVSYMVDFYHPWDKSKDKLGRVGPGALARDDASREKAYTELGFDQVWVDNIDSMPFWE